MTRWLRFLFVSVVVGASAGLADEARSKKQDADKAAQEQKNGAVEQESPPPVSRNATITIAGKPVPYRVTAGKLSLKRDDGKKRAEIFHVSYQRTDVTDLANRPVMFAFNGGPGSSAVWLHIGVLGPKIVSFPQNGTMIPEPPSRVSDNPQSILDVCDLVFIDPVSTGYSRASEDVKASEFHGVKADVESVAEFIRRWITEHDRWNSPKYLLGESYGGVRAAGLADHLQTSYGMQLNGVILLSSLLDFATLNDNPGNDLSHMVYLPAYAAVALHHGKCTAENSVEFLQAATDFAFGPYALALLKGHALDSETEEKTAEQLAKFSGIPAEIWIKHRLRIGPSFFRTELLRAEGKVLGRFDGRVAWPATDRAAISPEYDPSFALAYGGFSTALMDYLGREVGYKEERPYEILTNKVHPWNWDSNNESLNLSGQLADALRDNPKLRVMIMSGNTDLATPPAGVAYSLRHMPIDRKSFQERVTTVSFSGGHMFYLNPEDLVKSRAELIRFLKINH